MKIEVEIKDNITSRLLHQTHDHSEFVVFLFPAQACTILIMSVRIGYIIIISIKQVNWQLMVLEEY